MTKKKAIKDLTDYLKLHNISHIPSIDGGVMQINMAYPVENAPNKCIESCIMFFEDVAEARVYYSAMGAEICSRSEYLPELLRLLNFINARVFLSCGDGNGLYESHMLYTPRIYLTEDDCYDITITTIINYDFWEVAPLETDDYLTAYCPELLDKLTLPIFGVVLGNLSTEDAIAYIEREVLI